MPNYQFTLRRLLLGVTLICVVCSLLVKFPEGCLLAGYVALTLLPAIGVALVIRALSAYKSWAFVISLLGSVMGHVLAPYRTGSLHYAMDFDIAAPMAACGAFLFGGSFLFVELLTRLRRREPP
jgi:hypothetical protein